MPHLALVKPTHKAIQQYYAALQSYRDHHVTHEGALETAFQRLLEETAKAHHWKLIPKQKLKVGKATLFPDGTLRDPFNMRCGFWEAKDTDDDLDAEIQKKITKGYPLSNTIFEDTRRAVLFQGGQERYRFDLTDKKQLAALLNEFYAYTEPEIEDFHQAVEEFKTRVPELAGSLLEILAAAHKNNKKFQTAFDDFFALCQTALNPNISRAAVDEMLVQHLLTERLFRKIFDNPEFTRRNVIAVELEKVIDALVSLSFNRDSFLRSLDRFYRAIEAAAHGLEDFSEKQHFLNTIYERFFQGYSVKVADTHGIVYTPQAIVDFMCASVVEVLDTEFGLSLTSPGVHIIDPCTGTGNFIVNLINRATKKDLPRMYREQLFANEVMLLPYYIAALNIEHAYFEKTGTYEPFEGLCFVDTLDLAEEKQTLSFMTEKNSARVERQKKTPITVIIGNPPYNVGQINENDNNKNRKYKIIDDRIRQTYGRDSQATLHTKLHDPYVKFFRWAVDRLQERDGIVCFVSNNSFVDQIAFDGMRKHLLEDFTRVYHLDLCGNVRHNPKLSGTAYNVFGIQVGVGITLAIRRSSAPKRGRKGSQLYYYCVSESLHRREKLDWLGQTPNITAVKWRKLRPDARHTWLLDEHIEEFAGYLPLGSKEAKSIRNGDTETIFRTYSLGVSTNRDSVVYDFDPRVLTQRVEAFCDAYNAEVDRYRRKGKPENLDEFIDYRNVKWSDTLKNHLMRGTIAVFDRRRMRTSLYRPFCKLQLYYDHLFNDRPGLFQAIFPTETTEEDNRAICVPTTGNRAAWTALVSRWIPNLNMTSVDGFQCFPFYVYDEDGSNRRENITDWALNQFREHYGGKSLKDESSASPRREPRASGQGGKQGRPPLAGAAGSDEIGKSLAGAAGSDEIGKWDIFYYVYGILHHPGYREKFADNLKRELPRIPFAPDFWAFATAGKELARLHLDYEKLEPHPLKWVETPGVPLSYRVEGKMKLSKDKTSLIVNPSLTLAGIPAEVFQYRLGNRSALDWVIDQYQVSTDKRSGIESDPNRADDPEYIVRLVGQVVHVSLETVRIVQGLPAAYCP